MLEGRLRPSLLPKARRQMPALQNEQARSSPAADLHLAHLAPAVADRAVVVAASKSLSEPVAMKAPRANGEGSVSAATPHSWR